LRISCYTDAGYLTDADDLKSQTGYVFVLNGGAVDCKSAKQSIFATSSTEAEYIVAFDAFKEAVWVRKFIFGLGVVPTIEEPISMYCDNTGAIAVANESGITKGARHFRAKVHYLREVIKYGDVKLEKVYTGDNLGDPFTKALAFPKYSEHTRNIGMFPASSLIKFTSRDEESIESYYLGFYKMMNEMIENKLKVAIVQVHVQFLQQLQLEWSRFVTVVKQTLDLDTISYHKLFDILNRYQNEVNDIHAKKIARNEFGHFAKECRKPKRAKDYVYHKEKMMLCKQEEKGVSLSAKHDEWLHDTDEEPDEQEFKAHYMYMEKI
nr:hypothetical protein [Tanacetum cinerariifolium]